MHQQSNEWGRLGSSRDLGGCGQNDPMPERKEREGGKKEQRKEGRKRGRGKVGEKEEVEKRKEKEKKRT